MGGLCGSEGSIVLNNHSTNWAIAPALKMFRAKITEQCLQSSFHHSTLLWHIQTTHLKPAFHSVHTGVRGCQLRCRGWGMLGLNPASRSLQSAHRWHDQLCHYQLVPMPLLHRSDKQNRKPASPATARNSSYRLGEMYFVGILIFVLLKKLFKQYNKPWIMPGKWIWGQTRPEKLSLLFSWKIPPGTEEYRCGLRL